MTGEISTRYAPAEIEPKWRAHWSARDTFHMEPRAGDKPYTVVIPPPNITGVLHMGHGLNNSLQDVLVRFHRMRGYNTLWLPGTDHAGIATQNVVERMLLEQGVRKEDLPPAEFIARIWSWKDKYGHIIIDQLQRLGVSCDWRRQRFTMDEGLSRAVNRAFKELYDRGLIYRGYYMTNWCPRCKTALSDDEVEHEEVQSHLWHIRYPAKDGTTGVVVATTRPETMLGDTAVAVHPEDPRYARLIGATLVLPLVGREIPVVADTAVDPAFGTGAVKITPAHDPNDYAMAQRHDLPLVRVIDPSGNMTDKAGRFQCMSRFDCREALVHDLHEKGYLEKVEEHTHSVGHCYRCSTTLEPNLSEQWFVKMKPLARLAIEATEKNKVRFHPERWRDYYLNWLENVRDWCISRQIAWGHRIPVWYCEGCKQISVATEAPPACPACGGAVRQDPDVLDTWFSSALWPFSTLGWPEKTADLQFYYPTATLVTDRGIIYFWVARMVMMGQAMLNEPPFSDVFIHGTILDEQGRKMSKSLGNGIDPIAMIDQYGADAVRYALVYLTTEGQDIKLSPTQFEMGRNFMNKIWNASRFALLNLQAAGGPIRPVTDPASLDFYERWIIAALYDASARAVTAVKAFKFSEYAGVCYEFFWHELCDWYLEIAKLRMETDPAAVRSTLYTVLTDTFKLLHPIAPFITEELWNTLNRTVGLNPPHPDLSYNPWPAPPPGALDPAIISEMNLVKEAIRSIRTIRSTLNVPAGQEVNASISFQVPARRETFARHIPIIRRLAKVAVLDLVLTMERPKNTAVDIRGEITVFVPLAGLIDIADEKAKFLARLEQKTRFLESCDAKLHNQSFLANAPPEIINKEWERKRSLLAEIEQINTFLANLE